YMTECGLRKPAKPEKPLPRDWRDKYACEYESWLTSFSHRDRVCRLIESGNCLGIQELVDIGCALVASWIKGKRLDEIKQACDCSEKYVLEDERQRVIFTATCDCSICKPTQVSQELKANALTQARIYSQECLFRLQLMAD